MRSDVLTRFAKGAFDSRSLSSSEASSDSSSKMAIGFRKVPLAAVSLSGDRLASFDRFLLVGDCNGGEELGGYATGEEMNGILSASGGDEPILSAFVVASKNSSDGVGQ